MTNEKGLTANEITKIKYISTVQNLSMKLLINVQVLGDTMETSEPVRNSARKTIYELAEKLDFLSPPTPQPSFFNRIKKVRPEVIFNSGATC